MGNNEQQPTIEKVQQCCDDKGNDSEGFIELDTAKNSRAPSLYDDNMCTAPPTPQQNTASHQHNPQVSKITKQTTSVQDFGGYSLVQTQHVAIIPNSQLHRQAAQPPKYQQVVKHETMGCCPPKKPKLVTLPTPSTIHQN